MGKRTHDFAFVSLRYGRSGEEICTGYAMAASGRMQYDYKQTKIGSAGLGYGITIHHSYKRTLNISDSSKHIRILAVIELQSVGHILGREILYHGAHCPAGCHGNYETTYVSCIILSEGISPMYILAGQ